MLSIIIPTLNEQQELPQLLSELNKQRDLEFEIIVADGGSKDQTKAVAKEHGAVVVESCAGRGKQLNKGVEISKGDWFLVLHADSRLPGNKYFLKHALEYMSERPKNSAGHFPLTFIDHDNPKAYLYYEAKTYLGRPYTINGDQGLLLSRTFLDELGGFSEEYHFLEDQILSQMIFEKGEWVLLPGRLLTSARRFNSEGLSKRMNLSVLIMALYKAGRLKQMLKSPGLYKGQGETDELIITPFFTLAFDLFMMPTRFSWDFVQKVGLFIKENSWQIGHFIDVLKRLSVDEKTSAESWRRRPGKAAIVFDKVLHQSLMGNFYNFLAFLLGLGWFFIILALYYPRENLEIRARRRYGKL